MRMLAAIVAFVVGGTIAGVMGCVVTFYGLFGILRLVCSLAGSDDYMFYMWLGTPLMAIVGVGAFAGGGAFAALCTAGWLKHRDQKGSSK